VCVCVCVCVESGGASVDAVGGCWGGGGGSAGESGKYMTDDGISDYIDMIFRSKGASECSLT